MAGFDERRAADADMSKRPGVPMERAPSPAGAASWSEPERQPEQPELTRRAELNRLTPVFGSAQPPKGLAGRIRKMAYRIPEHKARHWMALLLADRLEVLGVRARKVLPFALPVLAVWVLSRKA